nr:caspase domain-containing protein [Mesorhizobium sp. BR1-1-16]
MGAAQAERRLALVLGNAAYQNAPALAVSVHDAQAIADKLQGLDFEVVSGFDQTKAEALATIAKFAKQVRGADIALFYYAGYALQASGKNYLMPVDAALQDDSAIDFETIPLDLVLRHMSRETGVRLVFLDASRANPLADALAASSDMEARSGLAEIPIGTGDTGSLIVSAASPDTIARGGNDEPSAFSAALLAHLGEPDLSIAETMNRVTADVSQSTAGQQKPWIGGSLSTDVVLQKRKDSPAPIVVGEATPPADQGTPPAGAAPAPAAADRASFDAALAKLPKLPSNAPVFFDIPLKFGDPAIDNRSIAQLLQGKPLFSPIEGLDKSVWDRECSGCHQWTKQLLCDQAKTYVPNPDMVVRLKHPLGTQFKAALRNWAQNGCQ